MSWRLRGSADGTMETCFVPLLKTPLPDLTGRVFDPETEPFCLAHASNAIAHYPWKDSDCHPEARAYLAGSREGIHVLLCALEPEAYAETRVFGGPVYRDSCLEFFLQPDTDDPRYVNLECNVLGAMQIGCGPDRARRILLERQPPELRLSVSRHEGRWWAVSYTVSFQFLRGVLGRDTVVRREMRGNFYKCAETVRPHFGCWSPVAAPQPDFHRPECFGRILLPV